MRRWSRTPHAIVADTFHKTGLWLEQVVQRTIEGAVRANGGFDRHITALNDPSPFNPAPERGPTLPGHGNPGYLATTRPSKRYSVRSLIPRYTASALRVPENPSTSRASSLSVSSPRAESEVEPALLFRCVDELPPRCHLTDARSGSPRRRPAGMPGRARCAVTGCCPARSSHRASRERPA
jgi:hypothetical protein